MTELIGGCGAGSDAEDDQLVPSQVQVSVSTVHPLKKTTLSPSVATSADNRPLGLVEAGTTNGVQVGEVHVHITSSPSGVGRPPRRRSLPAALVALKPLVRKVGGKRGSTD
jgi:hypothetical protein